MSLSDPDLLDAQNSLREHVAGFAGVGLTRVDGQPALALRVQDEPPAGWQAPQRWDGYPVHSAVIGRLRLMLP